MLKGKHKIRTIESVKVKLRMVTIEFFVKKLCVKSIYRLVYGISPIYDIMSVDMKLLI